MFKLPMFRNSKWLTYFCILLCIIMYLLLFLSTDWLIFCNMIFLLYKFTRTFIYFLFFSDEGPTLETLDFTIRIGSTPTFLYFELRIELLYRYKQAKTWGRLHKTLNYHLITVSLLCLLQTVQYVTLSGARHFLGKFMRAQQLESRLSSFNGL